MQSKEFIKRLSELSFALKQQIEASFDGWDDSPAAIVKRVAAVNDPITGFYYFVKHYFPHYLRHKNQSLMHEYLFEVLPKMLASERGESHALAAPRGEAKSTIVTRLFSLYCIVTGRKRYVVIISNTYEQAAEFLAAIKTELEFNTRLKIDFPKAFGMGGVWQDGKIVTKNNVKVQVAGAAKALRGFVHGAYRPDLVLLDDLENDENVRKPEQRDKLQDWLNSTVMKLGAVGEKFDVFYIGTILHYDSVLNRILKNKGWRTRLFKALIRWPDNMALWDEFEAIFHSDGDEAAEAYYLAHKAEMDKGAIVSWESRPLYELMRIRAKEGHKNFDTELQNDPVSGEDAPFANAIQFYGELPNDVVMFGALDPSLGKHGSGRDPSAILIGGYQTSSGKLFVLEAQIKKRLPDRIIEDVISLHQQYRCHVWAVEAVQFQEFLRTELIKRSAARGVPVPARAVTPHADKLLRIESLQPHLANGLILLKQEQSTLIEQLRHFPKADHDDGPDALHMLWALASSSGVNSGAHSYHLPEPSLWSE